MAHKIDNSKGFNAFVSFQEKPWHGLGEIFTEKITTQQALERGGLDFTVLKLPNVHLLPNGEEIISEKSFFTVRTDVNKVLGDRLGEVYQVLQNRETFAIVDEILQSGRATIETAGAIDEGRKVFVCLKIDKQIIVDSTDAVNQYVLIATAHDGSMSTVATPTNIRVVCNNTLTAALNGAKGALKIRHTGNVAGKVKEAEKVLNLISHNTEINAENYGVMKSNIISPETMFNYFGNIFCTPDEIKAMQQGTNFKNAISTAKQNILKDVAKFANTGIGQAEALTKGKDLNMWFAYNAVTGYMTKKKYNNVNDRAANLMFGSGAVRVEEAGVLALAPEKIQRLSAVNLGSGINLN